MINWLVGLFTAYLIVGLIIYCVSNNDENESWDWKKVLKFCVTWGVIYWNSYKEENKDENNDKKEEEGA